MMIVCVFLSQFYLTAPQQYLVNFGFPSHLFCSAFLSHILKTHTVHPLPSTFVSVLLLVACSYRVASPYLFCLHLATHH